MITFPDVSNYQAGLSLSGAPACIAKATEGTWFTDGAYLDFKAQAQAMGIPFAAYHWIDQGQIADQAAHAFDKVGPDTPLMWDAEALGVTVPRLLALTQAYRALGGTVTLLYLPSWWWHDHMGAPDLTPLVSAGLSLISSNYPGSGTPDSGVGWIPYGGMTPQIWQYTSTHPFNGMLVDFNAYQGSVEQLRALFNGQGGEGMQRFLQLKKGGIVEPAVYLTDGRMINYRWVRTEAERDGIIYWADHGEIQLASHTPTVVDLLDAWGNLVGPDPHGTPTPPPDPGEVDYARIRHDVADVVAIGYEGGAAAVRAA